LAALSAVRSNPALRGRLAARGKKSKVIQIDAARKVLVLANALVRSGQPWRPELAVTR
jgi:transposase